MSNHNAASYHPETCGGLDNQCCACERESLSAQIASMTRRAVDAERDLSATRKELVELTLAGIHYRTPQATLKAAEAKLASMTKRAEDKDAEARLADELRKDAVLRCESAIIMHQAAEAKLATAEHQFRAIRNTHGIVEAHQRADAGLHALGIDPSKEQGK